MYSTVGDVLPDERQPRKNSSHFLSLGMFLASVVKFSAFKNK